MKISKELLKTMAAGLILGATMTSCEKSEFFVLPDHFCAPTCEIDHVHTVETKGIFHNGNTCDDCPACGLG